VSRLHVLSVSAFSISLSFLGHGQHTPPDSITWFRPDQEVRVANLPLLTAPSTGSSAVLATALDIVLHDRAVCCGKNSVLEEDAVPSESLSLKELSAQLQGRHLPSADGHPIVLTAEYVPQTSINAGLIVGALQDQHALLIEWKSHLYVLYGAIFGETRYSSGTRQYSIHKLLLLDPRFSDQRRETVFNRETDDWGKIQGFLRLAVVRQ
jgi:hypothetical protein